MNSTTLNILALSDEILLTIFNKLDRIDVLYSLIGVNQKLDKLARDITFTRSVDLATISSNEDKNLRTNLILDRFYFNIIPRIQHNIEYLTLDPLTMERFLPVGNYPKLHKLNFVNFEVETASRIFNDKSSFLYIFKDRISNLAIMIDGDSTAEHIRRLATNIFVTIFVMFKNLTHLDFESEDSFLYPPSSLIDLPPTTCYSSNIVHLNVGVCNLDDCLCLLDGRFSQLHTFIVKIMQIKKSSMALDNKITVSNLKCFSLISSQRTDNYDTRIVPLIRQMSQLEKLTLSLVIQDRTSFIDGTQLYDDILCKMRHLQTFIFDIVIRNVVFKQKLLPCSDVIRRTFVERGHLADCYIDYYSKRINLCHVYSLPFGMKHMHNITNSFPGGLFMMVRNLHMGDLFIPFEHTFFARISQAFPLLNKLTIFNITGQQKKLTHQLNEHEQTSLIIEYSHLVELYLTSAHIDYLKQFLFNFNTRLSCLSKLYVKYEDLMTVTENFTIDAARDNCAKLKNIIFDSTPFVYSETFHLYFPSL